MSTTGSTEDADEARWEVVEPTLFSLQVNELRGSVPRVDDVLSGLKWAIARKPDEFPVVQEKRSLHLAKTRRYGDVPPMRVFFTFDKKKVTLRWIEPLPDEDEEGADAQ